MMKRSKFSEQQMAFLLRQTAAVTSVIDSTEKPGIEWCSQLAFIVRTQEVTCGRLEGTQAS